jgi:hypothetical protein
MPSIYKKLRSDNKFKCDACPTLMGTKDLYLTYVGATSYMTCGRCHARYHNPRKRTQSYAKYAAMAAQAQAMYDSAPANTQPSQGHYVINADGTGGWVQDNEDS